MLVVARRGRSPGGENDLAAVAVGVGGQERDLLTLGGTLRDGDEGIEPAGRRPLPFATDHLVCSVEVKEGHGDSTVLGLMTCGEQRISQPDRNAAHQVDIVGHQLEGLERIVRNRRGPSEQESGALGIPDHSRRERGRGLWAEHDLTGISGSLHGHDGAGAWAGDDELAVRGANEKEVEESAVDPDRHPQADPMTQDGEATNHSEGPSHVDGGATGPSFMRLTGEEQH